MLRRRGFGLLHCKLRFNDAPLPMLPSSRPSTSLSTPLPHRDALRLWTDSYPGYPSHIAPSPLQLAAVTSHPASRPRYHGGGGGGGSCHTPSMPSLRLPDLFRSPAWSRSTG
ncbi:hypothetical protein CGRA01v4_07435 [Colletotrichum graminicola]|nr:hypothetical protein CGRA01v4_07435 [Colletotrichum graminicola]